MPALWKNNRWKVITGMFALKVNNRNVLQRLGTFDMNMRHEQFI